MKANMIGSGKIVMQSTCDASWNDMIMTDNGRFCDHCAKEVFDFTQMSDEEVIRFMQSKQINSGCGRFTKKQVDNIQIPIHESFTHHRLNTVQKFVFAFLFFFGVELLQVELVNAGDVMQEQFDSTFAAQHDTTKTNIQKDSNVVYSDESISPIAIPDYLNPQQTYNSGAFMITPQLIPVVTSTLVPDTIVTSKSILKLPHTKKTSKQKAQTKNRTKPVVKKK
jgi:hypothetical protein